MKNQKEENRFDVSSRAKSFVHAGRGLKLFLKTTHNSWIQIFIFVLAIFCGFYFDITNIEWMILVLLGGLVLAVEALNTAFEIDINLTSPEYHPYARDTKDVAAAAVLISSLTALIVGLIIFGPYVL